MSPSEAVDARVLRRHFVAIATGDYDDPEYGHLDVDEEVQHVAKWLDDVELGDRRFAATTGLTVNSDHDTIRNAFLKPAKPWTDRDAAVVFVTGHGEIANGTHWTVLKGSDPTWLAGASLRTSDLISWLRRPNGVKHLLLIVDTCFAGAVAADVVKQDASLPETWLVLPSASKNGKAKVMALTSAIAKAVDFLRAPEGQKFGTNTRYFRVSDFVDTLRDSLEEVSPGQTLDPIYGGRYNAEHVCLPNPHYHQPDLVPTTPARHELALPRQDLERHWGPRALGAGDSDTAVTKRWLFTGRADLMRKLIAITRGDQDQTARVTLVTGGPGCGKSAVLARLVTLSDPDFRAVYPAEVEAIPDDLKPDPDHPVDVAVVASGKYAHDVLAQLRHALVETRPDGAEDSSVEAQLRALTSAINERPVAPTVVVDALDEAQDPKGIIRALATLASDTPIRLLVGVRSPSSPHEPDSRHPTPATSTAPDERPLADHAEEALSAQRLRIDKDPWWHQDDVRDYAASILVNTPGSPYQAPSHHQRAYALAATISQRVARSFLVARLAATNLTHRTGLVDPTDADWLHTLDDDVVGVFRDDLHRALPDPAARLRAVELLRAVAFSYGRGLPWGEIWPTVANAVADKHGKYGDRDIAELLACPLGGYLVTDVEDDVTVYRLFHQALRDTLRTRWRQLLQTP